MLTNREVTVERSLSSSSTFMINPDDISGPLQFDLMTYLAGYRVDSEGWFAASVSNCQWMCFSLSIPPRRPRPPAWGDGELQCQEVAAGRPVQRHGCCVQFSFLKLPPIRAWVGLALHGLLWRWNPVCSWRPFSQLSLRASPGRARMRFGGGAVPIALKQANQKTLRDTFWQFVVAVW